MRKGLHNLLASMKHVVITESFGSEGASSQKVVLFCLCAEVKSVKFVYE